MLVAERDQTRKGPWTEQEDLQLVCFVGIFGEKRWDFIAKVSGLNRTGKSCRLRWVNYLRPDLKRGRMTPHEESLVLELHARWGNRSPYSLSLSISSSPCTQSHT
ncbi:Myb-related protein [Nymphaea thermarum]|nr:Myb-related protein [Nymphaea thermarum]